MRFDYGGEQMPGGEPAEGHEKQAANSSLFQKMGDAALRSIDYVTSRPLRSGSVAVVLSYLAMGGGPAETITEVVPSGKQRSAPSGAVEAKTGKSDFSIVVLPDTQYEVERDPEALESQLSWIVRNRKKENIAAVMGVGDIVDNPESERQWSTARRLYKLLDGKLPFILASGNHDDEMHETPGETTQNYNSFIAGFGHYDIDGHYAPRGFRNTYSLLDVGERKLMLMTIEYRAPDDVLKWAGNAADQHSDRSILLTTHDYLGPNDKLRGNGTTEALPAHPDVRINDGVGIWRKLVKKHENIRFVFSGHIGPAGRLISRNDAGELVFQTVQDYQNRPDGGGGILRTYDFDLSEQKVEAETFSPYTGEQLTDSDNNFTFTGVDLGTQKR